MAKKNYLIDRRTVLKGLGATICLPLFEAMLPPSARAAEAMQVPRLYMHYYPNGTYPDFKNGNKFPQHVYDALVGGQDGLGDYVNIVGNLTTRGLGSFPGNAHANAFVPFMSASRIDYNKWNRSRGPGYDVMQETFDQRYARQFNLKTLSASCQNLSSHIVRYAHRNMVGSLSWYKDGNLHKPIWAETDPRVVFNKLVGGAPVPGQGMADNSEKLAQLDKKQLVLDSVTDQIAALKKRLGASDKIKLDEYLTDIEELDRRTAEFAQMLKEQGSEPQTCDVGDEPASYTKTSQSNYVERYRLIQDIFITGMECDQYQVFTFMGNHTNGPIDFSKYINITTSLTKHWHALSHYLSRGDGSDDLNSADPQVKALIESYKAVTGFQHQLLKETANKMRNKVDATGKSLLDNTLMVISSDMGAGQAHTPNVHVSTIGNAGGRFRTGQLIDGNKRLGSMWYTILKGLGVDVGSFGNSEGLISGLIA